MPGVGGADALVDQHVGGVQQTRVFQQREMRGKDRRFVLVAAQPGLLQAPLYVVAHPLQGLVQGEVLFLGTMPAVIRRQADGAEPRQGTAGDPQAHDTDQAVDAGHLPGEVQFGLAGKALRGLA